MVRHLSVEQAPIGNRRFDSFLIHQFAHGVVDRYFTCNDGVVSSNLTTSLTYAGVAQWQSTNLFAIVPGH